MTANHAHTPTIDNALDEIATTLILARFRSNKETIRAYLDQLIAQVESAAEQRGAERALLRAEKLLKEDRAELGETVSTQLMIDWLRLLAGQPINHKEEDDETH